MYLVDKLSLLKDITLTNNYVSEFSLKYVQVASKILGMLVRIFRR